MLIVVWFCVYVIEWKYVFAVYFDFCVLYEFVVKRRYIYIPVFRRAHCDKQVLLKYV